MGTNYMMLSHKVESAVSLDPIRLAQREWEKAHKYLDDCLAVWREGHDLESGMVLAHAFDEERTLFQTYEELCLEDLRRA